MPAWKSSRARRRRDTTVLTGICRVAETSAGDCSSRTDNTKTARRSSGMLARISSSAARASARSRRASAAGLAEVRACTAHVGGDAHHDPEDVRALLSGLDVRELAGEHDEDLLGGIVRLRRRDSEPSQRAPDEVVVLEHHPAQTFVRRRIPLRGCTFDLFERRSRDGGHSGQRPKPPSRAMSTDAKDASKIVSSTLELPRRASRSSAVIANGPRIRAP